MIASRLVSMARRLLETLERRGLVTWERNVPEAEVLMVTNTWPHRERPTQGPFVKETVEGLAAHGMRCDVLLIRGYRGLHAYGLGCLAVLALPSDSCYRLVHSHGGETALVARFFRGAPVLASYLGTDILGPKEGSWRDRLKCVVRSRVLRTHSRLMDATTTKTVEMASFLPTRVRERNWVIPDGIDRSRFRPLNRDEARLRLGWPLDEITVISVGRRVAVKRLWLAEQATALAAQDLPRLRWLTISDVRHEDMVLYYNAADCLLHTSASEGSPNVVKEALACDLPVVATPTGDIAELLKGVVPSALCEPRVESLAREVLRCASKRERSNGRELTGHLSLDAVAKRTLECYAALGVSAGKERGSGGLT